MEYKLTKEITALADDELKDNSIREELISSINFDRILEFHYEVQLIVSKILRNSYIKHPVPFQLRKKLLQELKAGQS
jgi:hypothetical protein